MSTYQAKTTLPQEFASTVLTTYGDNTTGYVTEIVDVAPYDLLTLEIEFTPAGAEDALDLQVTHTDRPTTAGFDPEATPPVGAYALPEDMVVPLLPSNLDADLEYNIGNVAARAAAGGGVFRRILTLDVLGLSKIRIHAKADGAGGTLVLSMLPNGPDRPVEIQAPVR